MPVCIIVFGESRLESHYSYSVSHTISHAVSHAGRADADLAGSLVDFGLRGIQAAVLNIVLDGVVEENHVLFEHTPHTRLNNHYYCI